jgi:ribosome-associated protein
MFILESIKVPINTEYIKLQQLIKLSGIVGQGSDAKMLIADGIVKVNGETVLERGKKIRVGDIVIIDDFGKIEVIE